MTKVFEFWSSYLLGDLEANRDVKILELTSPRASSKQGKKSALPGTQDPAQASGS